MKRFVNIFVFIAGAALFSSGETFETNLSISDDPSPRLSISFSIEQGSYLYKSDTSVKAKGVELKVISAPEAVSHESFGEIREVYQKDMEFVFSVEPAATRYAVIVDYMGCNDSSCFAPQTEYYVIEGANIEQVDELPGDLAEAEAPATIGSTAEITADDIPVLQKVELLDSFGGAMSQAEFLSAIDVSGDDSERKDMLQSAFEKGGLFLVALLILLGGVMLNLTPCVLPMIPINLAIIGAGAQSGSRGRGLLLGGVYGLAMALVYGALGLLVVLTRSSFGTLQSMWWFSAAIAVIFILLGLAMFDVFSIDFSRFQKGGSGMKSGSFVGAGLMGGIAALLAGACVAPVLISVLLLSAKLYGENHTFALGLPFLLGVGMGLPWPFAGAGLSFLPKPGRWMNHVKHIFGVFIIGMAIYYGLLAFGALTRGTGSGVEQQIAALEQAVDKAEKDGKKVLVDFWATWCKACKVMDKTVLSDSEVKAVIDSEYIFVKFQAEDMKDPKVALILQQFNISGLPGFAILEVKK